MRRAASRKAPFERAEFPDQLPSVVGHARAAAALPPTAVATTGCANERFSSSSSTQARR